MVKFNNMYIKIFKLVAFASKITASMAIESSTSMNIFEKLNDDNEQ